jgi:hypothetical protein
MTMAEHLLSLPPASRVNTVYMMRQMRPEPSPSHKALAIKLHDRNYSPIGTRNQWVAGS